MNVWLWLVLVGSRRLSEQWRLIAVLALASLVYTPPASAQPPPTGHWKIAYAWSGSVTTNGYTGALAHHRHIGGPGSTSAQASLVANVVATLTWVDSSNRPAPNPPKTVNLMESGSAYADCVGATWSASASNGLGDPTMQDSSGATSGGHHLIQKDGSSGTITLSRSLTASGSATDPVSRRAWVMVDYDYFVQLDPRAVWLSRSQIRAVATDPLGHIFNDRLDADGVTPRGDTNYSYNRTESTLGGIVTATSYNAQSFVPNWSAGWRFKTVLFQTVIDGDWSWSPSDWRDTWNYGVMNIPVGKMYTLFGEWKGTDTPSVTAITYNVTDSQDGAQASANYILTVHPPRELLLSYPDVLTKENPVQVSTPAIATADGQTVNCYIESGGSVTLGFSYDALGKWVGAWALGLSIDASYTWTWSTGTGVTSQPLKNGEGTYLEVVETYNNKSGLVNLFDTGGYTGTQSYSIKQPTGIAVQLHMPPLKYR